MRWKLSLVSLAITGVATAAPPPRWIGTWGTSPQVADEPQHVKGATIREIAKLSLGGRRLRLRLSNAYGDRPVVLGAVHVAVHARGPAIAPATDRVVRFHGKPGVTLAAGASELSDPIELTVADLAEVAISLYVPGDVAVQTEHSLAIATTYLSPAGDFTASASFTPAATTESTYLATDLEVDAPDARAIVVLGDSLTDGHGSTTDAHRRWTDDLAQRLLAAGERVAVINEGIAGNRLRHDFLATRGLARLDRDALAKAGARYLVLAMGLNDIGIPGAFARPTEQVSADEIIAAQREILERARARGLAVYAATLPPMEGAKMQGYATPAGEAKRQAVNRWLREARAFDGVIDVDAIVRDPAHPSRLAPAFDSGDHLHPNDAGYQAIAAAIDLALFRAAPARR